MPQDDVRAEEAFLEHRRALYGDLRAAESSEVAAAEKRLCDERCAEQCLVEEREQARFVVFDLPHVFHSVRSQSVSMRICESSRRT